MSEPTQAQRAAIDGEGYLVDPEEWDEALAVELAKVQGIELTDEHWLVIRFMRDYYAEHQICADARHAMKQLEALHPGQGRQRARNQGFIQAHGSPAMTVDPMGGWLSTLISRPFAGYTRSHDCQQPGDQRQNQD